jgi:hypothetical protein
MDEYQKPPDTLLKIASRFSSAVVRDTHELLVENFYTRSNSSILINYY